MSEEETWANLETFVLDPGKQWLDIIDLRVYKNTTRFPIRLGFGHTSRQLPLILIGEATEDDIVKQTLNELKGKEISDE